MWPKEQFRNILGKIQLYKEDYSVIIIKYRRVLQNIKAVHRLHILRSFECCKNAGPTEANRNYCSLTGPN